MPSNVRATTSEPVGRFFEALANTRARMHESGQVELKVFDDLTSALERVTRLDPGAAERLGDLAAAFVPAVLGTMEGEGELSPRELRDLRSVLRRLARATDAIGGRMVMCAEASLDVTYRRVDVSRVVRHVVEAFHPLNDARGVRVEVVAPELLTVEADPRKLEVMVVSLIFEATKHATKGGWLRVELRGGSDEWTLRTTDDGKRPLAARETAILCRSGEIERGTVTWVGEVPVGLGAVHDLVALHGGTTRLEAASAWAVVVTLPQHAPTGLDVSDSEPVDTGLAERAADVAGRQLAEEHELEGRRVERRGRALVLIVEDSRALQRVLVDSLEPEFATISAFDGEGALSVAIREKPDLVVLDLLLPAMDGEELVRQIRAAPDLEEVPILVLTASSDAERVTRLLEGPVQDVVKKPFYRAEVRARIRNLLAEKRSRDLLNQAIGKRETDLVRLAEQVSAQQEALRKAHEAAEAANRVKSGFLRTMSHELRTPITAMEIQMNIFQRDAANAPSEGARVGLARLARSTKRLRWLVDTVMAWARIEGGRYELESSRFDVGKVIREVEGDLQEFAELRGLRIECDVQEGATARSDRAITRLLVLNLVSRAIQMTTAGVVKVSAETTGNDVVVGVRDGAARISSEMEKRLFDPFLDGELHRRTGAGSGIDLHIVWDIARAIDGTVALERDREPGNLVTLTLPHLSPGRTTATFTRLGESEG